MTTLPLYDSLLEKLPIILDKLSNEEIDFVIDTIPKLEPSEHELIYILIRYHETQQTSDTDIIPYNGKRFKRGLKFTLDKLPLELQYILLYFVRLHLDTLNKRVTG